ncbi:AMP-binding protein [Frigidibacter albus]|uniref:3-methylmercaptopropionyl-CoA ligase n=1 Tax=Frigidibacter albus TaxID=1465486 RepID=A0A6L8VEC7_9RHOB|nr:acyl-CoA synthetase [Frigidibacter albus]MZQ87679.1 AMP-binding protein [Frigidibacter albus]NBE29585.1 AMP-binding protein [Frigidibacter albus]GGH43985.1 acyl-CoA synthetase [Frigidibacter albus]
MDKYEDGLGRRAANHQPMTPVSYLERATRTYPDHAAVIHGRIRTSYADLWQDCRRLASALVGQGVGRGDTVTVMLSNTPPMVQAHYGVPMANGAVLHSLNTRTDAATIAFQLEHAETRVLIVDREFSGVIAQALALAQVRPLVIDFDDSEYPNDAPHPKGDRIGTLDYAEFLASGDPEFPGALPLDEWDAIALNYTSGTTGNPKGVVCHHRGAALMALNNTIHGELGKHPVYLWTLPMFHCNGWSFSWSVAVQAGTHICLRWVRAEAIYAAIADHGVTHLCGAPIVMSTLLNAPAAAKRALPHKVTFNTAAAPPPEAVLQAMKEQGFHVNHLYGLTETYGPTVGNEWHSAWDALPPADQAAHKARQGIRYLSLSDLAVLDPETLDPVPADGETLGEVMFRGNLVMKGYLKNPKATDEAFAGGWFHSGDLGVMHPDGYVQLKDRSKDIIISGGENISSIEVEDAIYRHPDVALCAVVAMPDEKWGERPCAFVELRPGRAPTEAAIIAHCRATIAPYKCPARVVFTDLPKTSTGKIQKFVLRARAAEVEAG